MGNYSQLIFYGCCIVLVNNIANSDATFFGLLGSASSGLHSTQGQPRIAPAALVSGTATAPGAALGGNDALLSKLTQISSKLSLLLGGLGGAGTGGAVGNGNGHVAEVAEEIAPKIDDSDDDDTMKKDGDTDYIVEDDKPAEEEDESANESSIELQAKTPALSSGRKTNGNGVTLRKSITTSSSGRASSLLTIPQKPVARVSSQPLSGFVAQTRSNFSPGVLATIGTGGGYQARPVVQQTNYQPQPATQQNYYQQQPVVQPTYYQPQPAAQPTYYQQQPTVQRTGGYNYQNPGYRYKTIRYY